VLPILPLYAAASPGSGQSGLTSMSLEGFRDEWARSQQEVRERVEEQLHRQDELISRLLHDQLLAVQPGASGLAPAEAESGFRSNTAHMRQVKNGKEAMGLVLPSACASSVVVGLEEGAFGKSQCREESVAPAASFEFSKPSRSSSVCQKRKLTRHAGACKAQAEHWRQAVARVGGPGRCADRCVECYSWWIELQEPRRSGWIARCIQSRTFEVLCSLVILLNAAFTIYATNAAISDLHGQHPMFSQVAEPGFLIFYSLEIGLKLYVHRMHFFCNSDMRWNIFDVLLVAFSVYDYVTFTFILHEDSSTDMTFLRSFRLMKITRVFRMLRVLHVFQELRTMLNTLIGSFVALFWCLVMLGFILTMFGLIFVQTTMGYLVETGDALDAASRYELLDAFGSVETTMTTLFMATTGGEDWRRFYDLLQRTGDLNALLLIFYVAFFNFAVYNVLTGIFVDHTQKVAQKDRDTLILDQRRKERNDAEQLRRLCLEMDADRSGTITWMELSEQLEDEAVATFLASIGLDIQDAETFFQILASINGTEEVDIDTFVMGCLRLKGSATSIDMQSLVYETKLIHQGQDLFYKACISRLDTLEIALARNPPCEVKAVAPSLMTAAAKAVAYSSTKEEDSEAASLVPSSQGSTAPGAEQEGEAASRWPSSQGSTVPGAEQAAGGQQGEVSLDHPIKL